MSVSVQRSHYHRVDTSFCSKGKRGASLVVLCEQRFPVVLANFLLPKWQIKAVGYGRESGENGEIEQRRRRRRNKIFSNKKNLNKIFPIDMISFFRQTDEVTLITDDLITDDDINVEIPLKTTRKPWTKINLRKLLYSKYKNSGPKLISESSSKENIKTLDQN